MKSPLAPGLEVSTRVGCRVACTYCPQGALTRAYRANPVSADDIILKPSVFKEILRKIPSHVVITFAGYSEPWLNPDATEFIEHAHAKGHPIEVFTTLDGLQMSDIERLARLQYNEFTVHLPSDDMQMQLKVDEPYLQKLTGIVRALRKIRLVYYGAKPHPRIPEALAKLAEQDPLHNRAGHTEFSAGPLQGRRLLGTIQCAHMPVRHMVLPNGDVSLCCMDWSLRHRLGNLLEQSYESILNSPEMKRIEAGWKDETQSILCRQCPSGFHANVDLRAKWFNHRLPQIQQWLRRSTQQVLQLIDHIEFGSQHRGKSG
jgi:organic radical activating enzyme